MDIPRLQYSAHARDTMKWFGLDAEDLEAIVWYPAHRYVTHRGVEHEGWSSDGRYLTVVTDHRERRVITIVDKYRRQRLRRYSK